MKVRQILGRKGADIEATHPGATIGEVAATLSAKRIGCLMVMQDDAIAGIVSERDVVRLLGTDGGACLSRAVSEIMTADVVCCAPDDDATSILGRMTSGRFRHMPVQEDDKVVGLISIGDVVKARIDALESDNEALESMIRQATG